MKATLTYTDPETGEPVELDVTGWQLIISHDGRDLMRVDLPDLVMLVKMQIQVPGDYVRGIGPIVLRTSLLGRGPLALASGLDVLIARPA